MRATRAFRSKGGLGSPRTHPYAFHAAAPGMLTLASRTVASTVRALGARCRPSPRVRKLATLASVTRPFGPARPFRAGSTQCCTNAGAERRGARRRGLEAGRACRARLTARHVAVGINRADCIAPKIRTQGHSHRPSVSTRLELGSMRLRAVTFQSSYLCKPGLCSGRCCCSSRRCRRMRTRRPWRRCWPGSWCTSRHRPSCRCSMGRLSRRVAATANSRTAPPTC